MQTDKVAPFGVCFVAVLTGTVVLGDYGFIAGLLAAIGFAYGKEYYDASNGGEFSHRDLLADWLGIAAGTVVYVVGVFCGAL